jgi:hypothetical protein
MRELGAASEDEMVLEFIRAEIDSPQFAEHYRLSSEGRTALVDNGDPRDQRQNELRSQILDGVRGYPSRKALFLGFPREIAWRRVALSLAELRACRHLNYRTFVALSSKSRLVGDAAAHAALGDLALDPEAENTRRAILAIAVQIRNGKTHPALIAIDAGDGSMVLIEGNKRAAALAVVGVEASVEVLVGTSVAVRGWHFY